METLLVCGHYMDFNPVPEERDIVLCRRCDKYRMVAPVQGIYRLRCDKCSLARVMGTNRTKAYRMAVKHVMLKATHTVRVTRDYETEREISDPTEPIPGFEKNVIIDWLSTHPNHQSALKRLIAAKSGIPGQTG